MPWRSVFSSHTLEKVEELLVVSTSKHEKWVNLPTIALMDLKEFVLALEKIKTSNEWWRLLHSPNRCLIFSLKPLFQWVCYHVKDDEKKGITIPYSPLIFKSGWTFSHHWEIGRDGIPNHLGEERFNPELEYTVKISKNT